MNPRFFVTLSGLAALCRIVAGQAADRHWKTSYRLDYSYDPSYRNGPQSWSDVDVVGNEWEDKYSGGDVHDVRVRENVCSPETAGERHRPSPIALVPTEDCSDGSQIVTRPMREGDCTVSDWDFVLTPYGLRAYPPSEEDGINGDAPCDVPQLRLPGNRHPDPWDLRYLEVHVRSEHVLDGRKFDAELQMYHFGRGDDDYAATAVSVMVDASGRRDHVEFEYMLQRWERTREQRASDCEVGTRRLMQGAMAKKEGKRIGGTAGTDSMVGKTSRQSSKAGVQWGEEVASGKRRGLQDTEEAEDDENDEETCEPERDGTGCEPFGPRRRPFPYSLWPSIWYYRYRGSMTSPPCSDIVHWRVLDEPLRISKGQYQRLILLTNSFVDENCNEDRAMSARGENYRPLQSRNTQAGRQEVQHCTSDHFRHTMYAPEDQ